MRYPKRYVVDLDLPASERWNEVVHDHLDAIPGFMKAAHLPLGFIVSMNILYDIVAFDRKQSVIPFNLGGAVDVDDFDSFIFQMGCTSIIAENEEGIILHGRNLDYVIGDLLKNITILVDFVRWHGQEKKIVYSGVTFALSTTLITGQNGAFSVSLNARCEFSSQNWLLILNLVLSHYCCYTNGTMLLCYPMIYKDFIFTYFLLG
ncbi:unnamed protein product [Angiostrongylus costaricensis]|uniref:NAAA-beta domain-containing protein n=1 Tax=Angiostrongylus costaricensis TaxID=334426 RepID=A0A0R3PIJ1_ANGCS|nr:unnamed protein product [Angiostrongylus costaricensis]